MLKAVCIALGLCRTLTGPAYVYDGDTIKLAGVPVRLWGLDCEELSEPNGQTARAAMQGLVAANEVTCRLTGARSYNRYVGRCYVGPFDLARTMIVTGYCLDCAHYSRGLYRASEPAGARAKLLQKPYC